jgi:phage terminase large subunit GpA-like protein
MGYGREGEAWLVDRYNVSQSPNRVGEDGKALTISPFEYPEDWDALEKVIDRVYLAQSGAEMKSVKVLCDSGGKDDATNNAYRFWKKYAKDGKNAGVFWLIKGRDTGERLVKSETVLNQSGVPLWLLNVHRLKDESMFALGREEPGPRYVHFPQWLGDWFYEELRSEVKDAKTGKWDKRRKKMNNEAWDLLSYGWAGYTMAGGEKINFDSPPPWAIRADKRIIKAPATAQFNWATIGKTLNG